jgi:lysozyme
LGLTRRRLAEQALFMSKSWEFARTYEGPADVASTPAKVAGTRSLKFATPRMQGEDVRQLQLALQKIGFTLEADGVFGAATDAAVRQFQTQKGLRVDGIAGATTLTALA